MIILVTGGSGLVGQALKELIENTNVKNEDEFFYVSSKICDLIKEEEVDKLFNSIKPHIVIHLAANVGGLYCNLQNNYNMFIDNLTLNNNILNSCKKYNVKRLINILSTCIFPNDNIIYPLTSAQMLNGKPHSSNIGYAYAKRMLHIGSQLLSNMSNIEIVNLIPTNLYGKYDNYNILKSHVIPGLIHKCYKSKQLNTKLIIKGSGCAKRQFLYADDFATIIHNFIYCKLPQKFNCLTISPPITHEITIKELVKIIVTKLDYNGKIIYDIDYSDGQICKTTDSSELEFYMPNFKFTNLKDGLQMTIDFFKSNYTQLRT